jgi:hypothetical protein
MLFSAASSMAAENFVFKTVSRPFSFLFLFLPTAPASLCPPRRRSPPPSPRRSSRLGPRRRCRPAPRCRAAPSPAPRSAPVCGRAPDRPPPPQSRRHRPEPPSTAVQSPTLPPSTAAVQSTPPSSPLKALIVRYFFCVIYSIFSAAVV